MFCEQQINQSNIPSEVVKLFWQRLVYRSFHVVFAGMKPRFSQIREKEIIL